MVARNMIVGALILSAVIVISGCGGSSNTAAPLANFQPEIINSQDSFQFQATALNQAGATVTYNWSNTGTRATINHSSAITAGTTLLQIYDANNTMVYSDSLKASASDQTTVGTTGIWRVRVTISQVDGTVNFRAEKL